MRLAVRGMVVAAVVALAVPLTACERSVAPDRTAADSSRAQVVPAARALYRALLARSTRSVDLLDWGYTPCGTRSGTLAYTVSMRLFAFTPYQNTHFGTYRLQVVRIVRAEGWALRRHLSSRSVTLPTVPSAYYRISRQDGTASLTGTLSLAGDVNPLVGVSGIILMRGPCFDAGGAARSMQSMSGSPPFPVPRPAPS
jgi:hypothetical protein